MVELRQDWLHAHARRNHLLPNGAITAVQFRYRHLWQACVQLMGGWLLLHLNQFGVAIPFSAPGPSSPTILTSATIRPLNIIS